MGVVVRRYIDFLILPIPTPLISVLLQQHPYFLLIKKCFLFLFQYFFVITFYVLNNVLNARSYPAMDISCITSRSVV